MTGHLRTLFPLAVLSVFMCIVPSLAHADTLSLTSGSNATTTPSVATAITGFQIVGDAAATTPVKLLASHGTLSMTTTTGLTFDGSSSGSTIYFSGTVANINAALATLKYTRSDTGSDTLEVSLVNNGEVFFTGNNHLYKFISGSYTWNQASTSAGTQTAYGTSGYLATITSQTENDFVSGRLAGDGWIGGSDSSVEGDWRWVTGPEAGTLFWRGTGGGSAQGGNYAHWNSGEPNQSGDEDCAETYVASGMWNDLSCSSQLGYVVEFGRPGALPSVVAANISIVTADVPAVTTLFPANGALNATSTASLAISFSKTVTKDTGSILIKKTSDDSLVESIDVSGAQVTGSGTSAITIDPSTTFSEGVGYYVIVPNTAFKDSLNNHFSGVTDKTMWAFSIPDLTPPVVSAIASSSATTTASITWTTNEAASSRVVYSAGTSYASSTSITDTSPRVTSHTSSLSGLIACTTYNYKVVSADASANTATSTSSSFTTIGCPGNVVPTSVTTNPVTVSAAATSTVSDSGRTLSVATPANFTATSSSVIIQIKGMASDPVLSSIGTPSSSLNSAASIVFDVKALIDNTTVLDSFDTPVTISYTYTDADISGLNENTLAMYHYHDGVWVKLNNCRVDTGANTITCDTPSFSIFGIFGSPIVSTSSHKQSDTVQSQVANLIATGSTVAANALKAKWPSLFPQQAQAATTVPATIPVRDLTLGATGADVMVLQKFLNAHGYQVAASGPGSPGSETSLFGALTCKALAKFQTGNGIAPAVGYFGPLTRSKIEALGLK